MTTKPLLAAVAAFALTTLATPAVAVTPVAASSAPMSTGKTTLGDLLDHPASRAVLDKHLPGVSNDPQAMMGRSMTLRQIQPYASDKFTDAVLARIDIDLAKIAPAK